MTTTNDPQLRAIRAALGEGDQYRVYVSGPYTYGSETANVRRALEAADALLDAGLAPYVPHLWWIREVSVSRDYERWLQLDFAFLRVCDVLLRLPGHSPGSDREEAEATRLVLPIVHRGTGPVPVGLVREAAQMSRIARWTT